MTSSTNRGPGRPRVYRSEAELVKLTLRIPAPVLKRVSLAAGGAGVPISRWVVAALVVALRDRPAVRDELARITK